MMIEIYEPLAFNFLFGSLFYYWVLSISQPEISRRRSRRRERVRQTESHAKFIYKIFFIKKVISTSTSSIDCWHDFSFLNENLKQKIFFFRSTLFLGRVPYALETYERYSYLTASILRSQHDLQSPSNCHCETIPLYERERHVPVNLHENRMKLKSFFLFVCLYVRELVWRAKVLLRLEGIFTLLDLHRMDR